MDTARAMSDEDVAVVSAAYAAFRAGDTARALRYFDEQAVIDATARVDGGIGRGPQGFREVIGPWVNAFDDWREEVEEMRDLGDGVCVIATQHGRAKDTGIDIHTRYAIVYDVRDGAITSMKLYRGLDEALRDRG
jgi:ketosteroid isomerase-like protein